MGYRVRCLDDLSTGKQANVDLFIDNPNYEFIKGDVKDINVCLEACKGVDFVLHQAAWGSVPPVNRNALVLLCQQYTRHTEYDGSRTTMQSQEIRLCQQFQCLWRRRASPQAGRRGG